MCEIQKLLHKNLTKKEILNQLSITDEQYKYIFNRYGLKSNRETSIKLIDSINNIAICSICKDSKTLNSFELCKKKSGYTFYKTYCKECAADKKNKYINSDINKFLSQRFIVLKAVAKKDNIPFSISKYNLIDQYHKQSGLCFYTDLPMICVVGNKKHRDALSVDKIIPHKGYVNDNIVLCLNRINMAKNDLSLEEIKQWMPGWYLRIEKLLGNNA